MTVNKCAAKLKIHNREVFVCLLDECVYLYDEVIFRSM